MNMQALMRQAQMMQKEITQAQKTINETEFVGKNGVVTVKVMGTKEVKDVSIDGLEDLKDDLSMLEDMIMIAFNDAVKKVDSDKEAKIGKYGKGLSGLL